MNIQATAEIDFTAIKAKQNATWASGDYAVIGTTLQIVGERLAEAVNLAPGSRVLDVAAGNGNATLAFARQWHDVTSTDYVGSLLDKGRARAEAEGFDLRFQVADAEALPFADGAFDAAVSTFGVMFTPNQNASASELLRVVRKGGKIGLANWTPEGFIGEVFKLIGAYVPPPQGVSSPAQWGYRTWLEQVFATRVRKLKVEKQYFNFRYQSPEHFLDVFRRLYGPVHKAFGALDPTAQENLRAEFLDLINQHNTAMDGSMLVPSEYAQVLIDK